MRRRSARWLDRRAPRSRRHRRGTAASGRPAALTEQQAADVVAAFRQEGAAVKALARQFGTSPKTIRRALDAAGARELPGDLVALADPDAAPVEHGDQEIAPEMPVTADVPGLLADHLRATRDDRIRRAVISGRIIRRGQGYSVRLTALPAVHRALLEHCATLAGAEAAPAARKAYRTYAHRLQPAARE